MENGTEGKNVKVPPRFSREGRKYESTTDDKFVLWRS